MSRTIYIGETRVELVYTPKGEALQDILARYVSNISPLPDEKKADTIEA